MPLCEEAVAKGDWVIVKNNLGPFEHPKEGPRPYTVARITKVCGDHMETTAGRVYYEQAVVIAVPRKENCSPMPPENSQLTFLVGSEVDINSHPLFRERS